MSKNRPDFLPTAPLVPTLCGLISALLLAAPATNAQTGAEIVPTSYSFDHTTHGPATFPSVRYFDTGAAELTDGIKGGTPPAITDYSPFVGWLNDGWTSTPGPREDWAVNIDFVFSGGDEIDRIEVNTIQDRLGNIVIPDVAISSSPTGNAGSWTQLDQELTAESATNNNSRKVVAFSGLGITANHVRVTLRHPFRANTDYGPWIFCDEIDFLRAGDPIPLGAQWEWLHPLDGTDPAFGDPDFNTTWQTGGAGYDGPAFNPAAPAMLGYGTINAGPIATDIGTPPLGIRYSAYFRKTITLAEPIDEIGIELLADDGGVLYIDGVEVLRANFLGADTYFTHVSSTGTGTEAGTSEWFPGVGLSAGTHQIAFALHNQANSSDLGFDLRLFDSSQAEAISISFAGDITGGLGNQIAGGQTAGVVPDSAWNAATGAAGASLPLSNAGGSTGASVTWSSANTWGSTGATTDEETMVNGWLGDGGAGADVSFIGIPYANYDVYVYGSSDFGNAGRGLTTNVNGTDYFSGNAFATLSGNGSFFDGTTYVDASTGAAEPTYFRIPGLSGPDLTVIGARNPAGPQLPGGGSEYRGVISGIQIVEIPDSGGGGSDAFASRTALLGASQSVLTDNSGASREAGEPSPAGVSATQWWSWTPPEDGWYEINTFDSDIDTWLGVYTGSAIGSLTPGAFCDDAFPGRFASDHEQPSRSAVVFQAVAGTPYQITVGSDPDTGMGGGGGVQGGIALNLFPVPEPRAPATRLSEFAVLPEFGGFEQLSGGGRAVWDVFAQHPLAEEAYFKVLTSLGSDLEETATFKKDAFYKYGEAADFPMGLNGTGRGDAWWSGPFCVEAVSARYPHDGAVGDVGNLDRDPFANISEHLGANDRLTKLNDIVASIRAQPTTFINCDQYIQELIAFSPTNGWASHDDEIPPGDPGTGWSGAYAVPVQGDASYSAINGSPSQGAIAVMIESTLPDIGGWRVSDGPEIDAPGTVRPSGEQLVIAEGGCEISFQQVKGYEIHVPIEVPGTIPYANVLTADGKIPKYDPANIDPLNRTIGFDLLYTEVAGTDDIQDAGNSLVIIAEINSFIHIRIFDADGIRIIDKPENELFDEPFGNDPHGPVGIINNILYFWFFEHTLEEPFDMFTEANLIDHATLAAAFPPFFGGAQVRAGEITFFRATYVLKAQLSVTAISNEDVTIEIIGDPGSNWDLEMSTDLNVWQPLDDSIDLDSEGVGEVVVPFDAASSPRFYVRGRLGFLRPIAP